MKSRGMADEGLKLGMDNVDVVLYSGLMTKCDCDERVVELLKGNVPRQHSLSFLYNTIKNNSQYVNFTVI